MVAAVTKAFNAQGKKAIVILNIGGVIETASWKNIPDAILLAWQAGQEGGNTVVDVLSGKVNPSGKLTMTFPVNYADAASSLNFPANPPAKDMKGWPNDEDESKEPVRDIDYTIYYEDIYVGYRYFDTFAKEVSYPFGFGLSYTTFGYSNVKVDGNNGQYTVSVDVENTGSVAGKEVVQLYATAPTGNLNKPVQELKAFGKTKLLNPGEKQTVMLSFSADDLASYDEAQSAWVTDRGVYKLRVSASSKDVKATTEVTLAETKVTKTNDVLKVRESFEVLKP